MIIKRRTRSGQRRYGVRIDVAGEQEWVGTFDTIAEARHEEAQARRSPTSSRMSCDEWVGFWLKGYRRRVKRSSYDTAASALSGFKADFRGIPLRKLNPLGAERWARENTWRVPAVVTLLNAAVKAEALDRNPFAGLSRKGEGRKRTAPLTVAEVNELADRAHQAHGSIVRALVLFLAYTGLRVGEAFALEWTDVDFEKMRVQINRRLYRGEVDLPKSNRTRPCVLTPPARDALLPLERDSHLVFTAKRGGQMSQSVLTYYWQAISREHTPHELRHFAAHHLYVRMGLHERVVAAQLGHDDSGKLIRDLYGHGDVGALEEIDAAFENVVPIRRAQ